MNRPLLKHQQYLIVLSFCIIAALPLFSAGLANRTPNLALNRPLEPQIEKYVPVGSSTAKAMKFMESNGFTCFAVNDKKSPFVKCGISKPKWFHLTLTSYEVIFEGRDTIEEIHCSEYRID